MVGDQAMMVAGIGFRSGASWEDIVALVSLATAKAGLSPTDLHRLATLDSRAGEAAFTRAAAHLRLAPQAVSAESMRAVAAGIRSYSARVAALHGIGSVAEGSALAGAGADAQLILSRIASPFVTCALAEGSNP